jgi:hypothetical protein
MTEVEYPSTRLGFEPTTAYRPVLVFALTLASFTGGTGGAYQADDRSVLERMEHFRGPVEIAIPDGPEELVFAPSAAQLLMNVRDVFGLKMSELAQVFGVSRRAAYDWLGGAVPKSEMLSKFYTLSKHADEFKAAGIERVDHFLHRPIVAERTLLDLLKSGENLESAVVIIKSTAAEEALNRKHSARKLSDTDTAKVNGFDEESTPIID